MTNTPNALWVLAKGTLGRTFTLPNSIRYDYTGAIQTFTVPEDVTRITVELHGAQGGLSSGLYPGGKGAKIVCDFEVTEGAVYDVYVGGQPAGAPGGWPNGGLGDTNVGHGYGGGGRSEMRPTGGVITDAIAVAAGGGGAGDGGNTFDVHGGAAGFYAGLDGGDGNLAVGTSGGRGATFEAAATGNGGAGSNPGGGAALHTTSTFAFCGGGGGDGFYGGAGASSTSVPGNYTGGGGGGACYVNGEASEVDYTDAENSGHGFVIVSWDVVTPL